DEPGAPALLVYPLDRAGYGRLCRLLSLGKARAGAEGLGKTGCRLHWADLAEWGEGLLAVLLADRPDDALAGDLARLKSLFGDRAYCALT
ncbi:hypothetical protein, partial [Klebsiella pneumoniae]